MSEPKLAPLATWLTAPLSSEVAKSIEALRRSDDVQHVVVMPDVHLSRDVCVGTVVATSELVYPAAVGSDIGCGMAAVPLEVEAALLDSEHVAGILLRQLYEHVPGNKHRELRELPSNLRSNLLSDRSLAKVAERDGRVQLGTLGRGNHFLEFQADEEGRLWLMVHSGSRGVGQRISQHHQTTSLPKGPAMLALEAAGNAGQRYLADVAWARRYAAENRLSMLRAVDDFMQQLFGVSVMWSELIDSDHNTADFEEHHGRRLLVHRKGAQRARDGEAGMVPGSMGTASFHTTGRGCAESLLSCSHGAGRKLSRSEARRRLSTKDFRRQVGGLWFDHRHVRKLLDESPAAYKDIHQVMRAQRELLRIERRLHPVLTYKAT